MATTRGSPRVTPGAGCSQKKAHRLLIIPYCLLFLLIINCGHLVRPSNAARRERQSSWHAIASNLRSLTPRTPPDRGQKLAITTETILSVGPLDHSGPIRRSIAHARVAITSSTRASGRARG